VRARRLGSALVVAALLFGLLPQVAGAHDHRPPPSPLLTVGDQSQRGLAVSTSWTRSDPPYCVGQHGDGVWRFPTAAPYTEGTLTTIKLRKAAPPRDVELIAWRRLNRYGIPKGTYDTIPTALTPVLGAAGGVKAWELRFVPPVQADHLYLNLWVHWADEDGCGGGPIDTGSQDATWTFHLRRRG
jgi:hypothetical protein